MTAPPPDPCTACPPLGALAGQAFDVAVVGAGINGTAIARDAALRGLRVLLVDKGDIASGTSSRSARMIHGGLRYLEHGDVSLVREFLRERATLLRLAPHLVRTHDLIIPFYAHFRHRPWQVRLGLTVLDVLAVLGRCSIGRHRSLSRERVRERVPGLNPDGLTGACLMPDGYADHGERLCIENVLAAARAGASVATYTSVEDLRTENGAVVGLSLFDSTAQRSLDVRTTVTVNVAGPWVDRVVRTLTPSRRLIGGTKGSFLVLDPFPGAPRDPCFYESHSDHRQVVALPWNGRVLIGTTDVRYDGDPGDAIVTPEERDYLLGETNRTFPDARLSAASVRFAYAGVRPLPYHPEGAEGSVTRRYIVFDHAPEVGGLLSIVGGKFSTFRSLAEEATDAVFRKLGRRPPRCPTTRAPLPGAETDDFPAFRDRFRSSAPVAPKSADRLLSIYGTRSDRVLEMAAAADSDLLQPFDEHTGAIGAEILVAFRHEFARTLGDVLIGRTLVGYDSVFDPASAANAAQIAARHLGWDDARCQSELDSWERHVLRFQPPAATPPDPASPAGNPEAP
ncbi:MAG: glycerol-3-phosphate dehydrogenase/oxidase [bacterium]|nr:glycerol-3-phosphate dehydrogenase/oxidase [bacterium]